MILNSIFSKMKLFISFALLALLGLPAFAQDAVFVEKDKLGEYVREYLLENPEVLTEAQNKLETRRREATEASQKAAIASLPQETNSPTLGGKSDFKVIWFFDYHCGYCRKVEPSVQALLSDEHVKIVFKEFAILGEWSMLAARSAIAANKQGKFKQMHEWLYANPDAEFTKIIDFVVSLNGDKDQFLRDISSPETDKEIADVIDQATKLSISGTPAFIIGTKLIPGAADLKTLKDTIELEKKKNNS
jgi:protein-disulfide isomerase